MTSRKPKKVRKLITFPNNLIELVEMKAAQLGFDFAEYVRMILANDVKSELEHPKEYPYVTTPEEDKMIEESMKEYKKGNYTELKTEKDIENFLDSE